jgi:hypothetical protein
MDLSWRYLIKMESFTLLLWSFVAFVVISLARMTLSKVDQRVRLQVAAITKADNQRVLKKLNAVSRQIKNLESKKSIMIGFITPTGTVIHLNEQCCGLVNCTEINEISIDADLDMFIKNIDKYCKKCTI